MVYRNFQILLNIIIVIFKYFFPTEKFSFTHVPHNSKNKKTKGRKIMKLFSRKLAYVRSATSCTKPSILTISFKHLIRWDRSKSNLDIFSFEVVIVFSTSWPQTSYFKSSSHFSFSSSPLFNLISLKRF